MLEIAKEITFPVRVGGRVIHLMPPKIKFTGKITEAAKKLSGNSQEAFAEVVALILSANREQNKYSAEWVERSVTADEAYALITEYTAWIEGLAQHPNTDSPAPTRRTMTGEI